VIYSIATDRLIKSKKNTCQMFKNKVYKFQHKICGMSFSLGGYRKRKISQTLNSVFYYFIVLGFHEVTKKKVKHHSGHHLL